MNSREQALNILYKVIKEQKHANKMLNELSKSKAMSSSDIAFIYKLVYGTIQYKIYLEYVVNKIINPLKTDYKIQVLLWMNLYQIKFLKTSIYSVTNEAVELTKKINSNLSGLVNVVSKKLQDTKLWEVNIKNKQNITPLEMGFPFWLYKQIQKDYSTEVANKIVNISNEQCNFSFRVNLKLITQKEFEKKYMQEWDLQKSNIVNNGYLTNKNIIKTKEFEQGLIFIQDETSILAVELLEVKKNSKVLDMCCAPGGKLTYIATFINKNNLVDGYEINKSKEKIINQNLKRLQISNVNLNFTSALNINKTYNRILLDAPCSGFGVFKRKPEIKLKKYSDQEMQELYDLQYDLLKKAVESLDKKGILVYSTCTINKKENQNQIEKLLRSYPDINLEYQQQFFGFEGNNNGFYIAKLKK
ncbi:16S rRNA (cytosine967-C5)-methyltransferase [Spiroplasma gladiatoris]|uniref:16S rRNA (Cytosine967-C5)-methyltransferase n=1 Tax=Spiroplasma gladiatoris TaxID=2143 RepID=A0A4P7AJU1_9MOLU|nr:16S rRNA (cytosine(967)-C(5))-methyltransferase RsmB [Spiroplasma gladiatoris]QBQ08023.1 16S rRNA (cytosine967-C5)-methyltransferase [Spiroplasma gladiatoris]